MASSFRSFTITILVLSLSAASVVTALPHQELDSMVAVLRTRGYSLFANAVSTSDIYHDILAGTSFTLFAPTDSSLYALDMTATASDYIATLRRHVIPRRLSIADLRFLPPFASTIRTLYPNHELHVQRRPVSDVMSVDGVDLVVPGLFYGREIAVHGLGGIIGLRSQIGPNHIPSPPPAAGSDSCNFPVDLCGYHGSRQPVIDDRHNYPLPANFFDHGISEPASPKGTDMRAIEYSLPHPASYYRFSRAESPEKADIPAVLSPESSTGPDLAPRKEPPPPSVSSTDNDYQGNPSPSFFDHTYAFSVKHRNLMPFPTSTATEPETLDWPAEESETLLGHLSVQPGNPLTLQQSTCPPSYQF